MSLDELHGYIAENSRKIAAVHKELDEIQIGFNSAYVEWKAEHDASLERMVESLGDRMDKVGATLQKRVSDRVLEEREIIAARIKALEEELITQTMNDADEVLRNGQVLVQELRELNPQLNTQEEKLKSKRAQLESELNDLNDLIYKRSRGLGVVTRFIELTRLDRQRQQIIGKLKALQEDLKEVRETWLTADLTATSEQDDLQKQWQDLTLKRVQLQGELDFLQDETARENLALKRAIRYEIDNLKEPIDCPDSEIKGQLDEMVNLNKQTDDYQAAFVPLSGMISLLEGIMEGLRRFNESTQGLIDQQKMYSAYLPKLVVSLPDMVLDFHSGWESLHQNVLDEGSISTHPDEFLVKYQPMIDEDLSEARIKTMFENMGVALNQATEKWRAS
jgi:chromosome segregation ATPase